MSLFGPRWLRLFEAERRLGVRAEAIAYYRLDPRPETVRVKLGLASGDTVVRELSDLVEAEEVLRGQHRVPRPSDP